jgi:cystathionine gamma-synthase
MTHAGMDPDARLKAGVGDTLIRISVGIEDVRDLIADLEQAFNTTRPGQAVPTQATQTTQNEEKNASQAYRLTPATPALW